MLISDIRGTNSNNSTQTHSWKRSPAAVPQNRLRHRSRRNREWRTRRRKPILKHRENNTRFERVLLPVLSVLFGNMFREQPDHDRDDAVQDCLCQAWLAYSGLSAETADAVTAGRLAARIYRQYQAGGRFTALSA